MAYKILSLDGGGTWALIQARVLFKKYSEKYGNDVTGHQVLKNYDLVIANSGGSLVLAMLCANHKLFHIVQTFENVSVLRDIFKRKIIHNIPVLKDFLPNYHTENKYEVFREHLANEGTPYGDLFLDELPSKIGKKIDIIITTFDYDRERATYFRSNTESMMESYMIHNRTYPDAKVDRIFTRITLAQAVHASSNAPVVFFDDPASVILRKYDIDKKIFVEEEEKKPKLFWDGAVGGNNNPIKSALLEALANNVNMNDIHIVSIGTANVIQPILKPKESCDYGFMCKKSKILGFKSDLLKMSNSILSDPPDAATFDTHQIMRLPYAERTPRLIRINPLVKPRLKDNRWEKPGFDWTENQLKKLFTMDMAIATTDGVKFLNKLCKDFFEGAFDNQGIRLGGEKMEPILGHRKFKDALNDWDWG